MVGVGVNVVPHTIHLQPPGLLGRRIARQVIGLELGLVEHPFEEGLDRGVKRIGVIQETVAHRKPEFVFQRIQPAFGEFDSRAARLVTLDVLPVAERILTHNLDGDGLPRRILGLDMDTRKIVRHDHAPPHVPDRVLLRLHLHGHRVRGDLASVDRIDLHVVDIRVPETVQSHRIGVIRGLDLAHRARVEPVYRLDIEQIRVSGQCIGQFYLARQALDPDVGNLAGRGRVVPHRFQPVFLATHKQDCQKYNSKDIRFHTV